MSYQNNVGPGTAKFIITGIGEYTGTITGKFTIGKSSQSIKASDKTVSYSKSKRKISLGASCLGNVKMKYSSTVPSKMLKKYKTYFIKKNSGKAVTVN